MRPTAAPQLDVRDLPSYRSFDLPSDYLQYNDIYDFDAYGLDAVYVGLYGTKNGIGDQIWHVDLNTNSYEPLNGAVHGWVTLTPRISGRNVVWTANRNGQHRSVVWRVMLYDLDTHQSRVLVEGQNTRLNGGSADTAPVDIDGDYFAYTVEAPTTKNPLGWQIVVKRISDGVTIRTIDVPGSIWYLALSGTDVMFSSGADQQGLITESGAFVSTSADPEPRLVGDGLNVAISGDRMAWSGLWYGADLQPSAPGIWTQTIADSEARQLDSVPAGGRLRWPSVGEGVVAWNETGEDFSSLLVWDASLNRSEPMLGFGDSLHTNNTEWFMTGLGDGWLTWTYTVYSRSTFGIQSFAAVRVEDLSLLF